ncbi:MAG: helix-turn-helix domain-containing protein [Synergistaceae bacterium]|nr:helix-turn-helix domain-containing protein [Synergistaceae bacterium]
MTKLESARLEMGFTQPQLASLSGYGIQSILRWEKGYRSPRVEVLEKLAPILGKPIIDLIGYVNPTMPSPQRVRRGRKRKVAA